MISWRGGSDAVWAHEDLDARYSCGKFTKYDDTFASLSNLQAKKFNLSGDSTKVQVVFFAYSGMSLPSVLYLLSTVFSENP